MTCSLVIFNSNLFSTHDKLSFQANSHKVLLIIYFAQSLSLNKLKCGIRLIVYGNNISNNWSTLESIRSKICVIDVFKCLNSLAPPCYDGYFQKLSHGKGIRGDNNKILLPKVKTETARKRFAFQGAVLYNKLPVSFTRETSLLIFKGKCQHFF